MPKQSKQSVCNPYHVSLIAFPDAVISTLSGVYDIMSSLPMILGDQLQAGATNPFYVEIVAEQKGNVPLASGLSIESHKGIEEIDRTDIVIVPSVLVLDDSWEQGRYPEMVDWIRRMHSSGAILCSACSGIFLLAETGLFNGKETTVHWSYAKKFQNSFPDVPTNPERVLVVTGEKEDLMSSGASASWHDLVLYLITRFVAPFAAHTTAKFYALQWHRDGLAPYVVFSAPSDHDDSIIYSVQEWLAKNFSTSSPLESVMRISGLPERTFKRRFTEATGYSPINYIQRLRVEDSKRRLERSEHSVDEISWEVGYEDAAFFRKVFKRIVGVSPAAYRKKFQLPPYLNVS